VQAGREVLVVERSGDTAAVLRAVFEPQGVTVTSCTKRGASLTAGWHRTDAAPPVLVVDVDEAADGALTGVTGEPCSLVLIGRLEGPDGEAVDAPQGAAHLLKPFQYADLIRTVAAAIRPRAA
jgi:hypothetical protein